MRGRGVFVIVIGILFAIFILQLVFGAYLARNIAGATQLNLREDVSSNLTVLINNTETGTANNITQINITFPSSFTFAAGTNVSNTAVRTSFTNTTTLLSWSNWTGPMIMNQSWAYFSFNLSAPDPGFYNITVIFANTTGASTFNLTAIVNDTTPPTADFIASTPANNSYLRVNTFLVNTSSIDNWNISNLYTALYNSTNGLTSSNTTFISTNGINLSVNFSGLSDGVYYFNTTVNDTFNNSISNVNVSETRTITIDTVAPNITLTLNTVSTSDFNIIIGLTDGLSGINGSCTTNRPSTASVSGTGASQTLTETNLNCGQTVSYTVTCLDRAGNSNSNTTSFVTNACSSTSSSSSSSSSSTTSTVTNWQNTFSNNDSALGSNPISRALSTLQRTSILLNNEQHFVGVKSISGSTAVIEVSSTPQQGTLSVGQSKKFELTGDTYYDLLVQLVSIDSGVANITMQGIHESLEAAATQNNSSTNQTVTTVTTKGKTSLWVAAIAVLLVVAGFAYYLFFVRNKPNYG